MLFLLNFLYVLQHYAFESFIHFSLASFLLPCLLAFSWSLSLGLIRFLYLAFIVLFWTIPFLSMFSVFEINLSLFFNLFSRHLSVDSFEPNGHPYYDAHNMFSALRSGFILVDVVFRSILLVWLYASLVLTNKVKVIPKNPVLCMREHFYSMSPIYSLVRCHFGLMQLTLENQEYWSE